MKCIQATFVLTLLLIFPQTGFAAWKSDGTLKVAVMDIISRGENENIEAATISDMLQARLVEKKVFKIVERAMLNKILEEQKLHMMGLTDADASSVGAMAGADKIITGSISRMADQYVILIKGIDTRSGVVELTEQEMSPDARDLPNAIQVIADRIVRKARGESTGASSVPSRKKKIVFEERFQNNQNGWSIGDWEAAAASITDGQYVIRMKAQAPIFHSKIDVLVDQAKDFIVEATVAKLKGAEENLSYYGIIFGTDFKNMYEFLVHPNGKCMIRALQNGDTRFIQPSATSAHVQRGNAANTLRIKKEGEYFKFYLNGQFVNQDRTRTPSANTFLIGYEVWRTEGEKLVIAGRQITVSQAEPALQYEIMANRSWQDTVQVKAGQTITISASGEWNHGEPGYGTYGPEGCAKKDNGTILPGAPVGVLIGRINNQTPIVISAGKTFTTDSDGILQLCMNDWGFENNTGSIKAQIDIK